jgi:hypothetical protein
MTAWRVARRWRLWSVLIALVAVASLASGCMWGFVTDSDTGAAVSGANVTVTDSKGVTHTTTTDANGLYAFDPAAGPIPAAGPVTLEVSASGYEYISMPVLVQYNDNPNASLPNLSSFWEVQNVEMTPWVSALNADMEVTDAYPDNQPSGVLWVTLKNNGPDTLNNVEVDLSCGYERTNTATCSKDTLNAVIVPVLVSLAPGHSMNVKTGIGLDTATYWYRTGCTILPYNPQFGDPNQTNDLYFEVIPPAAGDLELADVWLGADNQVALTVGASGLGGSTFCWDITVDGHSEVLNCSNSAPPSGTQAVWTGLAVNGTESVAASVWSCLPETDEFNNQMVKTCSSASHSCW